jgi:hypothetical protein
LTAKDVGKEADKEHSLGKIESLLDENLNIYETNTTEKKTNTKLKITYTF